MTKQMCPGVDYDVRVEKVLERTLFKCTTCDRVLRTRRTHQVPGRTTRSHDKTLGILWEFATDPRQRRVSIPLDAIADLTMRAATAGELAVNRQDVHTDEEHVDEAILERVYADAVLETITFMSGLAGPSEALKLVLRSGRVEGDDLPEDGPLGYPVIERAF